MQQRVLMEICDIIKACGAEITPASRRVVFESQENNNYVENDK